MKGARVRRSLLREAAIPLSNETLTRSMYRREFLPFFTRYTHGSKIFINEFFVKE